MCTAGPWLTRPRDATYERPPYNTKTKTNTTFRKARQIQSGLNHGGPANGSVVSKKNACLESLGITIMKADNYGRKSRTDMMIVIKKSYDGKECGRA